MLSNLCKGDKWPLGIVTAFFMLTVGVSTILALTVSQQAAYLWLSFVLIGILFLTTFTRNSRTPIIPYDSGYERRPSEHMRACGRFVERSGSGPTPPYFVRIDPPPSYNAAITIYPDNCEPPPYINVVIQNSNPPTPTYSQALTKSLNVLNPTPIPPLTEQLPILYHLDTVQNCSASISDDQLANGTCATISNSPLINSNESNPNQVSESETATTVDGEINNVAQIKKRPHPDSEATN